MTWFRCLIHGENFLGETIGQAGTVGFYVTRFVQAEDAAGAEATALEGLRSEPKLAPPPDYIPTGMQARVFLDKIEEVDTRKVPAKAPGFSWYRERKDGE